MSISAHNVHPGCPFFHGCGDRVHRDVSFSAKPEAQLEEQVGKNEGGELGWGPAFPTKVYTVSQAGRSLPLRKA